MRPPISVTIITLNEEHNIARCLESVKWAEEIVLLDTGSTDNTVDIATNFGCQVFIAKEWKGFGIAKQEAVSYASNDWILSIDADEVITPELKKAIEETLTKESLYPAYRINRKSFFLGKLIKHCGWNNDYPIRLFNKHRAGFNDKTVHESVVIRNGSLGTIHQHMLHYTFPTIESHYIKMERYASLTSKNLFDKGRRSTPIKAMFRGLLKFLKMYLLQLGFLDGNEGLVLSFNSAWGVYLKYIKLWELRRESTTR